MNPPSPFVLLFLFVLLAMIIPLVVLEFANLFAIVSKHTISVTYSGIG